MRQASERGFELIKKLEGWMSLPYLDVAGYGTIGYGHLLDKSEISSGKVRILRGLVKFKDGLTECQGSILLDQDLEEVEVQLSIDPACKDLEEHQYDAIVSFTMNVGIGAFKSSTLRKRLIAKELDLASAQLLRWVWAGGKKIKGLENRRRIEKRLFETGDYGNP